MELARLWQHFAGHRDEETREQLILAYIPYAKAVANAVARTAPPSVTDDIRSHAHLGLISAIDRFDPTVGIRFEAYANARIRGEISDGLRGQDWMSRRDRAVARRIRDAEATLAVTGRKPTLTQIATHVGEAPQRVAQVAALGDSILHIDTELVDGDGTISTELAAREGDVADTATMTVLVTHLMAALTRLPEPHSTFMWMRYALGLAATDIADLMETTAARVYRYIAAGLTLIREHIALGAA